VKLKFNFIKLLEFLLSCITIIIIITTTIIIIIIIIIIIMTGCGLDRAGSRQGQVAGTCECGNEPSDSIKCGESLDWLKNGQLLKDSDPWTE
jgi:hypothetical protein